MSQPGRLALRALEATAVLFGLMAPASFGQAGPASRERPSKPSPAWDNRPPTGPSSVTRPARPSSRSRRRDPRSDPTPAPSPSPAPSPLGPQTDLIFDSRGTGAILEFQASFSITSQFPTGTATGTKQLAPTAPGGGSLEALGRCDPDGSSPPDTDLFAIVRETRRHREVYDAQINAITGSTTDSGTSGVMTQSVTNLGFADHVPGGLHLHRAGPAGMRGRQQRERSREGASEEEQRQRRQRALPVGRVSRSGRASAPGQPRRRGSAPRASRGGSRSGSSRSRD